MAGDLPMPDFQHRENTVVLVAKDNVEVIDASTESGKRAPSYICPLCNKVVTAGEGWTHLPTKYEPFYRFLDG